MIFMYFNFENSYLNLIGYMCLMKNSVLIKFKENIWYNFLVRCCCKRCNRC